MDGREGNCQGQVSDLGVSGIEVPRPTSARRRPSDLTELLRRWSAGSETAADRAVAAVYSELRAMAAFYLRDERPGHTLQPTALVNEVFVRLFGRRKLNWFNRAQFFSHAGEMMRRILIDHARLRLAAKREGFPIHLDSMDLIPARRDEQLIALDDALSELERREPRKAEVVKLRFFCGLTIREVAETLDVAVNTVDRDWAFARAWLSREIVRATPEPDEGP